jgi:hypothetical protein
MPLPTTNIPGMNLNPIPFNDDFLDLLCHERSRLLGAAIVDAAGAVALAMSLADSNHSIELFEESWPAVDLRRAQLSLADDLGRVGVHHIDALACPSVRAALAASRSILLFPRN